MSNGSYAFEEKLWICSLFTIFTKLQNFFLRKTTNQYRNRNANFSRKKKVYVSHYVRMHKTSDSIAICRATKFSKYNFFQF